jgi:hypothetical protein
MSVISSSRKGKTASALGTMVLTWVMLAAVTVACGIGLLVWCLAH